MDSIIVVTVAIRFAWRPNKSLYCEVLVESALYSRFLCD
jgi:hypothetical protein